MQHSIQTITEAYTITALGLFLDDYQDWSGNAQKISARKAELDETGQLAQLLESSDGVLYEVNSVAQETGAIDQLTGQVFGSGLQKVADYKYVGPYNFSRLTKQADGTYQAEMWLPVIPA